MTKEEITICKMYLEEMGKDKDCNEYKLLMQMLEQQSSDDCVSREQALLALTGINLHLMNAEELIALFDKRIKALPPVTPTRKVPREDITEDEVKINMLELAFNQVKEQAEGIEVPTDKYRLIFKAEKRDNKVGWSSLENIREKVERGSEDGSN